jgi:DNA-directed RNA polymerase beta' subunit
MTDQLQLHYTDLKIVMETYQNVIQLNTLLVEQQKQILELQKELIKSQTSVSDKQFKINEKIENMIKKTEKETENFHKEVRELDRVLHERFNSSETSMHSRFDSTDGKIENAQKEVDNLNIDMIKGHSSIKIKLYIALVGSVLIILALLGLLTTSIEKFSVLGHVHELVEKIVTFLKIP